MHRFLIRLGSLALSLVILSQLFLPPYAEHRLQDRLTEHGGTAKVDLDAIPAARLLFGHGSRLDIRARGLSVDLESRPDVFKRLDRFGDTTVYVRDSRAGPFAVGGFFLSRRADHEYLMVLQASAAPADVARYAGDKLGGGFGGALAGLAAGTLANSGKAVPVNARVIIDTSSGTPRALGAEGEVGGLPAGPLAQVVANALLGAL